MVLGYRGSFWWFIDFVDAKVLRAEHYGWKFSNGLLPVITSNLSIYGCRKECLCNRCKCSKNNLACTKFCKSTSCKNGGNDAEKGIAYLESDNDEWKIKWMDPLQSLVLANKSSSFVA